MKTFIDMGRPNMLYAVGVGLLMVVSLVLSNVPQSNLSLYLAVPFRREVAAALFASGVLFGLIAMLRQLSRNKAPWKVPQSQVFVSFALFFLSTLAGLVIAK
jgi:hypothetical protein